MNSAVAICPLTVSMKLPDTDFNSDRVAKIHFDNASQLWRIRLLSDSSTYATTETIPIEYPLGNRMWDVESQIFKGQLELNLNSCDDFNSFNCNDGACIKIEER